MSVSPISLVTQQRQARERAALLLALFRLVPPLLWLNPSLLPLPRPQPTSLGLPLASLSPYRKTQGSFAAGTSPNGTDRATGARVPYEGLGVSLPPPNTPGCPPSLPPAVSATAV